MRCDCGSGSTLIPCDFVEFDTWLREWTMGCDCGSGSTLTFVTLLSLIHGCGSGPWGVIAGVDPP